jgi:hypothetical protein
MAKPPVCNFPNVNPEPPPKNKFEKAFRWFKKKYAFVVSILVFIGGFATLYDKINKVKEFIKTDHQEFLEKIKTPPCTLFLNNGDVVERVNPNEPNESQKKRELAVKLKSNFLPGLND